MQVTRSIIDWYLPEDPEDNVYRILTGHVPRLVTHLETEGIPVRIVDRRRFGDGFRHDPAAIELSNGPARMVMQTIAAAPQGQLLVNSDESGCGSLSASVACSRPREFFSW